MDTALNALIRLPRPVAAHQLHMHRMAARTAYQRVLAKRRFDEDVLRPELARALMMLG